MSPRSKEAKKAAKESAKAKKEKTKAEKKKSERTLDLLKDASPSPRETKKEHKEIKKEIKDAKEAKGSENKAVETPAKPDDAVSSSHSQTAFSGADALSSISVSVAPVLVTENEPEKSEPVKGSTRISLKLAGLSQENLPTLAKEEESQSAEVTLSAKKKEVNEEAERATKASKEKLVATEKADQVEADNAQEVKKEVDSPRGKKDKELGKERMRAEKEQEKEKAKAEKERLKRTKEEAKKEKKEKKMKGKMEKKEKKGDKESGKDDESDEKSKEEVEGAKTVPLPPATAPPPIETEEAEEPMAPGSRSKNLKRNESKLAKMFSPRVRVTLSLHLYLELISTRQSLTDCTFIVLLCTFPRF